MVRKCMLAIAACFTCLMLVFSAGSACATATSSSEAIIYWDTFGYSFTDAFGAPIPITEGIDWLWQDSWSEAGAESDFGYDDDDEWVDEWTDTSAEAWVPYAEGNAWTDDYEVGEDVWAEADGINAEWAEAWASAERYGEFEALQSGFLTVWADYFLSQDLSTDYLGEYAAGYAYADLGLHNYGSEVYDYDEFGNEDEWNEVWDRGSYSDSVTGRFETSLWFEEGDGGGFWAYADNAAYASSEYDGEPVIPEPTTMFLFSIGFLGFGFARRKRRGTP